MKGRKLFFFSVAAGMIFILSAFSILHISGVVQYTNSPFDGANCSQCHSGGATTPTVTINANPAFVSGNSYLPGNTYTIDVTVSGAYPKYGFNTEVLDSNNPNVVNDAGICGPAVSSNCTKYPANGSIPTNYTHNIPSGSAGSATFSFQWTAPASGSVYIYTSGLGANNTGSQSGDKVSTYSVMLSPSTGIEKYDTEITDLKIFPNPAGERINFSYSLQESGEVSVQLLALNGDLICELLRETQNAGAHTKEFRSPETISKGIYFIKISVNGKETAKKILTY